MCQQTPHTHQYMTFIVPLSGLLVFQHCAIQNFRSESFKTAESCSVRWIIEQGMVFDDNMIQMVFKPQLTMTKPLHMVHQ